MSYQSFKGINRKYIGQMHIIRFSTDFQKMARYRNWRRIRACKRLVQGVRTFCPPGKPILRKSILSSKTLVFCHISIFVSSPVLLIRPTRGRTPFEAGSTDRELEISVLDTFRDGFRSVPYVSTWLYLWMHNSNITTFYQVVVGLT